MCANTVRLSLNTVMIRVKWTFSNGSTDGWTWCRLNLMRWWQQMVTNDVVEKSNKLVHGRYKEHYQFVQLDGSKFHYNLTQRFQNKPNLCSLQAPIANDQIWIWPFGRFAGDGQQKWPIWEIYEAFWFKILFDFCHWPWYWSFYARLTLLICAFLTFIFFRNRIFSNSRC